MEKRKMLFNRLMSLLKRQIEITGTQDKVKIIINRDDGRMLIGKKRNEMIKEVTTPYTAFIDDDDLVDGNYIREMMFQIEHHQPDAIGFKGLLKNIHTGRSNVFIHKCGEKYEKRGNIYFRPVNHLNPMRTEFFREVPFPELAHGEDYAQCLELQKRELITDCAFIDKIMYHYFFNPNK